MAFLRVSKNGQKLAKMSENLPKVTRNLQKRALF